MPNSKIKAAVANGDLPNFLYKYRALNSYTENLIVKGELFFTLPKNFNDPYEFNVKDSGHYNKADVINYLQASGSTPAKA